MFFQKFLKDKIIDRNKLHLFPLFFIKQYRLNSVPRIKCIKTNRIMPKINRVDDREIKQTSLVSTSDLSMGEVNCKSILNRNRHFIVEQFMYEQIFSQWTISENLRISKFAYRLLDDVLGGTKDISLTAKF